MAVAKDQAEKRTKVIVQSIDKEKEVFVSLNGESALIMCGVEVELTDGQISVLKNAVEVSHEPYVTEDGVKGAKQVAQRKYMIEVV